MFAYAFVVEMQSYITFFYSYSIVIKLLEKLFFLCIGHCMRQCALSLNVSYAYLVQLQLLLKKIELDCASMAYLVSTIM